MAALNPYTDLSVGAVNPNASAGGSWVVNPDGTVTGPDGTAYPIGSTLPDGSSVTAGRFNANAGSLQQQNTPPAAATPQPTSAGGGGGGTTVASPGSSPTQFNWPTFTAPTATPAQGLTAPNPYVPTTFNYGDFNAPTLTDAQNQPGYTFGLQQGQQAVGDKAASLGLVRGGGFLKDLFNYTNAAGEQNYQNVYNQDQSTYNTNRGNAYQNWSANETNRQNAYGVNAGIAKDVNTSGNAAAQQNFNNANTSAVESFNPQFAAANTTFTDMYNRWLAGLNATTSIATNGAA